MPVPPSWGESEKELLHEAKRLGFSDFQIARALWKEHMTQDHPLEVRRLRKAMGIIPVVKQIDTLAARGTDCSNYLYLTYGGQRHDITYENDGHSVVVLGSGLTGLAVP